MKYKAMAGAAMIKPAAVVLILKVWGYQAF